ncbi:hypothetical protein IAT40_006186 [Kwoniella sp. CBS 6097]
MPSVDAGQSPRRDLRSLFIDSGYTELLEQVIENLGLGEIARLIRVNRHINDILTSSSHFQLRYRTAYHAVPSPRPPPYTSNQAKQQLSSSDKLARLLEREERFDTLNPSSIKCIHQPNSVVIELKSGYLLCAESMHKKRMDPSDPTSDYTFDAYTMSREIQKTSCSSVGPNSTAHTLRQIYFYCLTPPAGTAPPYKNIHRGGIRHPEAKVPFIEVRTPAKYHLHHCKIRLGNNGRVGVSLKPVQGKDHGFFGVWDWKHSVSLGSIAPSPYMIFPIDFRFFGPFVMTASFGAMPRKPEPEASDLKSEKSSSTKPRRSRNAMISKIGKGYKVGKGSFSQGGLRQRQRREDSDSDSDSDLGLDGQDPPEEETFCFFDTFELLNPSNGCHPSPIAHRAYTEEGYDPHSPCTWDYQDITPCNPLVSFLSPPFNPDPHEPDEEDFMFFGGISLPILPAVIPDRCELGEINIDEALVKGERDGVMIFTIRALIYDQDRDKPRQIQCQGTINLRTLIDRITTLLMRRIAFMPSDRRGRVVQTELDTMWSASKSVNDVLRGRLAGQIKGKEDTWETDPESDNREDDTPSSGKRGQGKGKSKGKGKGRGKDKGVGSSTEKKSKEKSNYHPPRGGSLPPLVQIEAYNPTKFSLDHVYFHEWSHACSLRFDYTVFSRFVNGSRVFSTATNPNQLMPFFEDGGLKISAHLVMQDFNRNVSGSPFDQRMLHRPIGGFQPQAKLKPKPQRKTRSMPKAAASMNSSSSSNSSPFTFTFPAPSSSSSSSTSAPILKSHSSSSTTRPSSSSPSSTTNKAKPLALTPTKYGTCPLVKPIALPQFSGSPVHTTSEKGDKCVYTDDMFDDVAVVSKLRFTETRSVLFWDAKRPLHEIYFDGERLVIYMQNGAHIFTF